jgi:hypothetical protein
MAFNPSDSKQGFKFLFFFFEGTGIESSLDNVQHNICFFLADIDKKTDTVPIKPTKFLIACTSHAFEIHKFN